MNYVGEGSAEQITDQSEKTWSAGGLQTKSQVSLKNSDKWEGDVQKTWRASGAGSRQILSYFQNNSDEWGMRWWRTHTFEGLFRHPKYPMDTPVSSLVKMYL
jgi:hypothetical protein